MWKMFPVIQTLIDQGIFYYLLSRIGFELFDKWCE